MHPYLSSAQQHSAGTFDFGGVPVDLISSSRHFRHLCRERYGAFVTEAAPAWRVVYRVRDGRVPSPHFLHDARRHPMRSRRAGGRLKLASETFEMELDASRRRVEIAGPLATYPLDRLIQALWYESHSSGLMIHAAALADGGRGWIFSGPSGAGKSTLAALFPEHALCDELVVLTLDGPVPRLGSLPFWTSRRGSAELAGIHLLCHGERDRRRRLGAGEAFARLRREVVWPTFDREALNRAFDSLCRLIEAAPSVGARRRRRLQRLWFLCRGDACVAFRGSDLASEIRARQASPLRFEANGPSRLGRGGVDVSSDASGFRVGATPASPSEDRISRARSGRGRPRLRFPRSRFICHVRSPCRGGLDGRRGVGWIAAGSAKCTAT